MYLVMCLKRYVREVALILVDPVHPYKASFTQSQFQITSACCPSPLQAPPQYLPCTVHGVVEECLLNSSFEGLPVPTEVLTNILLHLCIIGEVAVTTAPYSLQHTQCRVYFVPALLRAVAVTAPLRTEQATPSSSTPVQPSTSASPGPLASDNLSSVRQEDPLLILSRSRVLHTTFIPALCRALSESPVYSTSGVYLVHDAAFNQISIRPHKNVQLNVQVFDPHSNILGSHSGIKVEVDLAPQHLEPVIRHLMHAVSLVEQAYGLMEVEWATPCPQRGDSPHPLPVRTLHYSFLYTYNTYFRH